MDVLQRLMNGLDPEGRYLLVNAIANQLRYPNNHTHYFSCALLYLFAEAQQEIAEGRTVSGEHLRRSMPVAPEGTRAGVSDRPRRGSR